MTFLSFPAPSNAKVLPITIIAIFLVANVSSVLSAEPNFGKPVNIEPEIFQIKSPEPIFSWVMDSESGRVFASTLNGSEIIEFSPTMKTEVRRFSVGKKPERMLVKNKRLVVLCQDTKDVHVINLITNKSESRIRIDCKYLCGLTASRLKDPFVYVTTGHSGQYGDPIIYKINLDSLRIEDTLKEENGNREYIVNANLSDFGSAFVFDRRGYLSPSGADFANINPEENTFERLTQTRESYAVINTGPAERFWTFGPTLVSFEGLKPIRKFDGHIVSIHRSLDLAVSLDVVDKRIDYWQFSNAKKIKSVTLDELDNKIKSSGTRKKTWKYDRDVGDPTLQFDRRNQAVFCGLRTTAFLVPHGELVSQLNPQVLIESLPTRQIQLGDGIDTALKLTNEKLNKTAEFKLVSAPDGAKLDGKDFSWKPTVSDVGEHQVIIAAEVNGVSDSLTMTLNVKGVEIDLGILTQTWAVSPSGKYAIAWGAKSTDKRNFIRPNQSTPMEMIVVDLSVGKVINQGQHDKPVQAAAIDDKYVYVVPQNSNILNRYEISDLENKKRIFLAGSGLGVMATEDSKLLVHFRSEGPGLSGIQQSIIDPETLKVDADDPRTGNFGNSGISYPFYSQLEKGMATDGSHIYDSTTGAIKQILQPYNTGLTLIDQDALRSFQSNFGSMPTAKRWGRTYDRSSLRDGKGNQICQVQYPFAISAEYPIGVGFETSQKREGRITITSGQFKFYDLIEGGTVGTQSLFKSTSTSGRPSFYSSGGLIELIHLRGKFCHALYNGKIYSAQIPNEILAKVKSPLRILNPKSLYVDLTQPKFSIRFETPDYEKVKFSLVNSLKNVELDEETGVLTIETDKIWQQMVSSSSSTRSAFDRIRSSSRNEQQQKAQDEARRRYQLKDDQLGYLLPISIAATGDDGQSDKIQFCLVATGDKKVIDEKIDLLAKKQMEEQKRLAKMRADQQAAIQMAREKELRNRELGSKPKSEEANEVAELKKKIRRLEAVIDSLIDRIEKLESKKGK